MAIKNSPGYNTFLSCFMSFLIIKRYKMTRMNIEISPIGMNGYVIIFDMFFCFSFVVYGACIMAANDLHVSVGCDTEALNCKPITNL
jgi:hypothetical protein